MDISKKLLEARAHEEQNNYMLAYEAYTELLDFAFKHKSLPNDQLTTILDRAEFCKRNMNQETSLVLNLPEGCLFKDRTLKKPEPVKVSVQYRNDQTILLITRQSQDIEIFLNFWLVTKVLPPKISFVFVNHEKHEFQLILDSSQIEKEYIGHFQTALETAAFRFVKATPQTNAEYLAAGIIYTGDLVSSALEPIQKKASQYVGKKSENYIANTVPNEKPTEINPVVEKSVEYGAKGAIYARKGAEKVLDLLGQAVASTGEKVADKLRPSSAGEKGKETWFGAAVKVGGASLHSLGNFWGALEKEGTQFGRNARQETMKVVTHKHGEQAGKVAGDACRIVIDTTKIGFYYSDIGMKAIAKKTIKTTGKQMLKN